MSLFVVSIKEQYCRNENGQPIRLRDFDGGCIHTLLGEEAIYCPNCQPDPRRLQNMLADNHALCNHRRPLLSGG